MKFNRLLLISFLVVGFADSFAGNTPKGDTYKRGFSEGPGAVPSFSLKKSAVRLWKNFYKFFYIDSMAKALPPLLFQELKTGKITNNNTVCYIIQTLDKKRAFVGRKVAKFRQERNEWQKEAILKEIEHDLGYNDYNFLSLYKIRFFFSSLFNNV